MAVDDVFWRLHDKLVKRGARRQALRYYPRRSWWKQTATKLDYIIWLCVVPVAVTVVFALFVK